MNAKSNKDKKAEAYALAKSKGVKNYTFPAMPATQQQLTNLCERYGFEDWRELVTVLILNVSQCYMFELPRHQFVPTAKALRLMELQSEIEALLTEDDDDE